MMKKSSKLSRTSSQSSVASSSLNDSMDDFVLLRPPRIDKKTVIVDPTPKLIIETEVVKKEEKKVTKPTVRKKNPSRTGNNSEDLQLALALSESLHSASDYARQQEEELLLEENLCEVLSDLRQEDTSIHVEDKVELKTKVKAKPQRATKKAKEEVASRFILPLRSHAERQRLISISAASIISSTADDPYPLKSLPFQVSQPLSRYLNDNCSHSHLWQLTGSDFAGKKHSETFYVPSLCPLSHEKEAAQVPKLFKVPGRTCTQVNKSSTLADTQAILDELAQTPSFVDQTANCGGFLSEVASATNKLVADWEPMVGSSFLSDVTVQSKDSHICAHRIVLAVRCPDLLHDSAGSVVNWTDYSDQVCRIVLRYLYTAQLTDPGDEESWHQLTLLAQRYSLTELLAADHKSSVNGTISFSKDEEDEQDSMMEILPKTTPVPMRERSITPDIFEESMGAEDNDPVSSIVVPFDVVPFDVVSSDVVSSDVVSSDVVSSDVISSDVISSDVVSSDVVSSDLVRFDVLLRKETFSNNSDEVEEVFITSDEECINPVEAVEPERSSLSSSKSDNLAVLTDDLMNSPSPVSFSPVDNLPLMNDELMNSPLFALSPVEALAPTNDQWMNSPARVICSEVILKTPVDYNRMTKPDCKKRRIEVTPQPEYQTMATPILQQELDKYGLKPLKRKNAVKLLEHIYEELHPLVTDNEESFRQELLSEDSEGYSLSDAKEEAAKKKATTKKTKMSYAELKKSFRDFFASHPAIWQSVLTYDPIAFDWLRKAMKQDGIACKPQELLDWLDEECITVRMKDRNRVKTTKQKSAEEAHDEDDVAEEI